VNRIRPVARPATEYEWVTTTSLNEYGRYIYDVGLLAKNNSLTVNSLEYLCFVY